MRDGAGRRGRGHGRRDRPAGRCGSRRRQQLAAAPRGLPQTGRRHRHQPDLRPGRGRAMVARPGEDRSGPGPGTGLAAGRAGPRRSPRRPATRGLAPGADAASTRSRPGAHHCGRPVPGSPAGIGARRRTARAAGRGPPGPGSGRGGDLRPLDTAAGRRRTGRRTGRPAGLRVPAGPSSGVRTAPVHADPGRTGRADGRTRRPRGPGAGSRLRLRRPAPRRRSVQRAPRPGGGSRARGAHRPAPRVDQPGPGPHPGRRQPSGGRLPLRRRRRRAVSSAVQRTQLGP